MSEFLQHPEAKVLFVKMACDIFLDIIRVTIFGVTAFTYYKWKNDLEGAKFVFLVLISLALMMQRIK